MLAKIQLCFTSPIANGQENARRSFFAAFAASIALMLGACSDSDNGSIFQAEQTAPAQVRVTHASPDAPNVNINFTAEGAADPQTVASNVPFGTSTGTIETAAGTYSAEVIGLIPGGNASVIGPTDLVLEEAMRYDVFAIDNVSNIRPLIVTAPVDYDDSKVRVAVAHLAGGAPAVDVHVTAPDAMLDTSTVLGNFAFEGTLGPVEIDAGSYRIRVTLPGETAAIYDTGETGIDLTAGVDLVIAAVANTSATDSGASKSPIALLVINGDGASTLYSANDGADLRVAHNSADAPAVDIVVNDGFAAPLVEDLAFPTVTAPYANVPAGDYNVKVAPADSMTAVITADLSLANGAAYTVLAVNTLDMIEPLVLVDDVRPVATEAKVRIVHGSTLAGPVDIYVTAPGADITGLDPAVSNLEFKSDTGFVSLAAGSYDVTVTGNGSKTAALGPLTISLENGKIYNAIARDEADLSNVNLTLLDAFLE